MKSLILIAASLFSVQAFSGVKLRNPIHILPDAPSSFYQSVSRSQFFFLSNTGADNSIQAVIKLGEKNMNWLKHMNSLRDEAHQLRLTRPGELSSIPITSPKKYNPQTVADAADTIKKDMPQALKDVYYSNNNLPDNPPVSDDVYVEWAKKVDKNYQTATRWMMMQPYLDYLTEDAKIDVRGYYFMSHMTDIEAKLRGFSLLAADEQAQFSNWLLQLCQNSAGLNANCAGQVSEAVFDNRVYEFYLKYLGGGEKLWNEFFGLYNPRSDMEWTAINPLKAVLPFLNPNNNKIMDFLKVNIEDEWKWNDWHLNLDFRSAADVHVEFQPGVTPHVNGLGGNTIVMDANTPLTEWDVQWTIRHEFGHVLGFTDCYVEFYDVNEKAIINYQLDIDNLMCSRRGRMMETHYTTLKKAYLR